MGFKYLKMSKMNNFKNIKVLSAILIFATLAFNSGCKKLLDQKPEDALTRDEFFKTQSDAESAIAGVYDALQSCVTQFLYWGETRGDLVTVTANDDNTYPYFQLIENFRPISNWTTIYTMIGRANIVIESVPGIPEIDASFTQQESDAIVSEARFQRALGYFYLVRTFKDVPLVLNAPSNDDVDYRIPKSPASVILKQIEEDLAFADQHIPVKYLREIETRGRATKGAVNALQADVFLWQAKYTEAAAAAKKVIDNKTIYQLVPGDEWFNIFAKKNTTEGIMEIQFDYTLNENNNLKGIANNFNMNTGLRTIFLGELDELRGLNRTYRESGGSQYWKYRGLTIDNVERPTNDPNFIVYRLADVMLMRAEALAHLGFAEKTEAIALINDIRNRVRLLPYDSIDGNIETPLLIDMIMKERAMELAMEGKRWFDLVRVATNDNRPEFLVNNVVNSRTVGERSLIRARIIDPRSWYLPILKDELDKNPNLVQNPFYR
jgi:hypothetical protein